MFIVYDLFGLFLAILGCFSFGMGVCVLIALAKSFSRPKNIKLAVGYISMMAVSVAGAWLLMFVAAKLADYSGHASRPGIIVGLFFPGYIALRAIPQCIAVANKQTSGIVVE